MQPLCKAFHRTNAIAVAIVLFISLCVPTADTWEIAKKVTLHQAIPHAYIENIIAGQDAIMLSSFNNIIKVDFATSDSSIIFSSPGLIYSIAKGTNYFLYCAGAPDWRFIREKDKKLDFTLIEKKIQAIDKDAIYGAVFHIREDSFIFNQLEYSESTGKISGNIYSIDLSSRKVETVLQKKHKIELLDYDPSSNSLMYSLEMLADRFAYYRFFLYRLNERTEIEIQQNNFSSVMLVDRNRIAYTTHSKSRTIVLYDIEKQTSQNIYNSDLAFYFFVDHYRKHILILEIDDPGFIHSIKMLTE